MKIRIIFIVFSLIVAMSISCKKEKEENTIVVTKSSVNGVIQKGPFISGSSISIYEMDASLSQTGKSYTTQITNNKGTFQLSNVALTYAYVCLRADGFYFNEITGLQSNSQISLYAVSDLTNKSSINVNILSHIEKPRIEYLVSQGIHFSLAKKQAEQEILNIFSISKNNLPESETLDITKDGDDNAILLAISLILQGYRTEAELTELLSNLSLDIKQDGVLSNNTIGTDLLNHAKVLNLSSVRQNIQARWNILGISDTISNFEYYVNKFIDSTSFAFANFIQYPYSTDYGVNLLNDSVNQVETYNPYNYHYPINTYSLTAILKQGHTLKVVLSVENPCSISNGFGVTFWNPTESAPYVTKNWSYSFYGPINGGNPPPIHAQTFTSILSNDLCNTKLFFYPINEASCSYRIDIYENNSVLPTKTKYISVIMTN